MCFCLIKTVNFKANILPKPEEEPKQEKTLEVLGWAVSEFFVFGYRFKLSARFSSRVLQTPEEVPKKKRTWKS